MKKLKSLKTGLLSRNIAFAKMLSAFGKDFIFSSEEGIQSKIGNSVFKRSELILKELGQLKGSFLKAGQMLSLYAQDILPEQLHNLFIELQSQTSYLEWDQIKKQIPPQLFENLEIEKDAFAAASIGQVHKAVDKHGQVYAVKIQYDSIEKLIDNDLWMLKKLLSLAKLIPKGFQMEKVFEEIKQMLIQEMDYNLELEHMQAYRTLASPIYIVPKAFPEYCGPKVLVTEFIAGDALEDKLNELSESQKSKLAKEYFELFLFEIYRWHTVQSDAHLGNYLIQDDKWVLLDFGATKKLNPTLCSFYQDMINGMFNQDEALILKAFKEHGALNLELSDQKLLLDYIRLVSTPLITNNFDWKNSTIAQDMMKQIPKLYREMKFNFIPHENLFIDRKISGLYYILKKIGAQVDLGDIYREFTSSIE